MHLAADYGQLEVLEYLAAQGADINAKDKHGISVILAAIWEGHVNCVKFLLSKVCCLTFVKLRNIFDIYCEHSLMRYDS